MAKKVNVGDLAEAITEELENWKEVTFEEVESLTEKHGKELQKRVKKDSRERTGAYRKGWRVKKEMNKNGRFTVTIYNKTRYYLTHLLEHGHATKNGGRSKTFPHLLKNQEDVSNEYIEDIERLFK